VKIIMTRLHLFVLSLMLNANKFSNKFHQDKLSFIIQQTLLGSVGDLGLAPTPHPHRMGLLTWRNLRKNNFSFLFQLIFYKYFSRSSQFKDKVKSKII